ncbi:MAG: phosphoribosylanthranilate isomerase [Bacteroidota bacterium]|nr:phosphoribosylanthranilate isomerase [Bacteroidota bacterium]
MKLKVCGLNNKKNIEAVVSLKPDFVGFIFYSQSKRYILKNNLTSVFFDKIPKTVKKVGVFVDASFQKITETFDKYKLDYIQLHGNEDKSFCERLFLKNIPLIKAFAISDTFNFSKLKFYVPYCDFFLFDARGKFPGGNGIKFSWELLKSYSLELPFFISGGISPDDIGNIESFDHEKLYGVDINSRFEIEPGIKNVNQIEKFYKQLNKKSYEY